MSLNARHELQARLDLTEIYRNKNHIHSIDDQITRYVPELKGTGYDGVTIREALRMRSVPRVEQLNRLPGGYARPTIFAKGANRTLFSTQRLLEHGRSQARMREVVTLVVIDRGGIEVEWALACGRDSCASDLSSPVIVLAMTEAPRAVAGGSA
ncbi:MAG TPA: hypothetical protein VF745_05745 [Steroidobacteraceae bacterium]